MAPTPLAEPLTTAQGETLLDVARRSIVHGLLHGRPLAVGPEEYQDALQAVRASFVTLTLSGKLRGCIGALEATMPLVADVAEHAFAAAFRDPRFPPLTEPEFGEVDIHISVLTPATPMDFEDEADLLSQLRPGEDGLIIAKGARRATFLPSVWASLPDPVQFLSHLKLKAGIDDNDPREPLRAWRYTTESIPS
jgi:AmmeMemoRadiSam system protein A